MSGVIAMTGVNADKSIRRPVVNINDMHDLDIGIDLDNIKLHLLYQFEIMHPLHSLHVFALGLKVHSRNFVLKGSFTWESFLLRQHSHNK